MYALALAKAKAHAVAPIFRIAFGALIGYYSALLFFQLAGWDAGFMNLYADMTGTMPKIIGPVMIALGMIARDHIHNERLFHWLFGMIVAVSVVAWSPQIYTFLT
jgi:hypothetical protein